MKEPHFLVRVNCMTYNHTKYIREALDGFCMQETNFPFICTIIDDASTDGEPELLKSYLQEHFDMDNKEVVRREEHDTHSLIYAQHKMNHNCFFAVILLKYNHHSIRKSKQSYASDWRKVKYYAPCEGDDFWTSPQKLQRQVDFMESHPNHSLCFHANYYLFPDGSKREEHRYNDDLEEVPMKDMIIGGGAFMATNSMLYLQNKSFKRGEWARGCSVGDGPTMLTLAALGKVGYINEVMSCYRYSTEGSWHHRILEDKKKFKEHYHITQLSWKKYDEWTDFKYHNIIKRKMRKNKIHFWANQSGLLKRMINIYKNHIKHKKRR